ncbi:glycosyltransferase [Chroococcidiopsis thermalis]|uniref:Glycosyl transferase family 2 n=1 Tax=Chroococcidiopsis thermalis (strain PCC 7203) TaxID=251229 RepID=K9TZ69_CHRTP|nr:glycosyltransferase [Chroococcidiopsis thermalis]AFY87865.1 glycosyl transferase family 2 [Chroococcidiopsis thermalis PCC 7203]
MKTVSKSETIVDKPLVSGIVIFLNEEQFIEEAIASVFAQTYNNWELLLVDDGSTDGSTAIARRYAEQYPHKVRYLEHENHQNCGMSAARNLGVRHAQGEYIAFLDADDIWLPQKLVQQVAILESQPEAAMLYGRTHFWFSWTGNQSDRQYNYFTELGVEPDTLVQPPTLLELFLQNESTVASTCSVLIRREVFQKIGEFEPEFRTMYEDMVFYTKIFLQAPVFVSGKCWDRYRQHPQSSCRIAIEEGEYNSFHPSPARGTFLRWVEAYLRDRGAERTQVWSVLQTELLPYRYPLLYPVGRMLRLWRQQAKTVLKSAGRRVLPRDLLYWLKFQKRFRGTSHLGGVRFGNLRRLKPVSQNFGFNRGLPIDRYYIEKFLASHADAIRGHVLEVSENKYTLKFGSDRVSKSDILHVTQDNLAATIVADLTCCDENSVPSNTFDCIIITQTLPFIYDVRAAIATLHRILKPGGVILATFAGISQVSRSDMETWGEYWRFTTLSTRKLFSEAFPAAQIKVEAYGNVLAAMSFLQGLAVEELRQEELDYFDPDYELLISVRVTKPEVNHENTWENTWSQSDTTVCPSLSQPASARVADSALSSRH